ncbi:DUF3667 domain-containing protein [Pollutibacter soli]|uniref:DUF3667 domain-containing protein n=1 Tax=Pollutibacter soli TaxID=3034157 RepID=UPI003013A536
MVKELTDHFCLNCETVNPPGNKFCGQCGQKMEIHRISAHEITHDAVHYFTHADRGIFFLLKKLATKPGVVAREYLAGKRTQYFKPLNFLLIVAALTVFMTSFLSSQNQRPPGRSGSAGQSSSLTEEQKKVYAARYANLNKVTTKYTNVIQIFATPLITLFVFLFYLKRPYSYLEHLVANMYFVGAVMIFYALVTIPLSYFSNSFLWGRIFLAVFFLFEIVYRGIAYYQFMNQKGTKYKLKALGVSVLASVFWIVISGTLTYKYIQDGLWGIFK